MPIFIKDETANALVLTIDNNGNMAFADGTPIDLLTLGGYGVIDSEGYIVHGLGSSTAVPASGSVTCGFGQSVNVTTLAGQVPIVQLDTVNPAHSYRVDPAGGPHVDPIDGSPLHTSTPDFGSFTINNHNVATEEFMANPTFARLPNQNADVTYRWM